MVQDQVSGEGVATPKASPSGAPLPAMGTSTAPGTILGTMQYMAPEQLEGKEADARTDLFAFGAVLYEMVTGKRAFEGKSQAHLIAAIISVQPDPISKTIPSAPPALDFLVERCLAKDPDQRVQTATDVVAKLRWIAERGSAGGAQTQRATRRRFTLAQSTLAAVILLVIVMAVIVFVIPGGTASHAITRFLVDVPDMPVAEAVSISPDGRLLAYTASDGGSTALFVRPLNREAGQKLPGTEGAGRLFWSPDSRWIAFFAGGRLKKVEAIGGPPQNICETADLRGGYLERGRRHRLRVERGSAARARGGRTAKRDSAVQRDRKASSARALFSPRRQAVSLPCRLAKGIRVGDLCRLAGFDDDNAPRRDAIERGVRTATGLGPERISAVPPRGNPLCAVVRRGRSRTERRSHSRCRRAAALE
jgi:hypothetical protein